MSHLEAAVQRQAALISMSTLHNQVSNKRGAGLGKGDVKIFMSLETLKVQKETLPTEEGLFLVSY